MKKTSWFEEAEDRYDEHTYEPDLYISMYEDGIILKGCSCHFQMNSAIFMKRSEVDGFIESLIEARDIVFNEKEER
jgi:hypothetical protein